MDIREFLKNLTTLPGVYQMYAETQQLLYVGKAKNLKKRLSSYFNSSQKSSKTAAMLTQVVDIQVTVTPSEAEALLLECRLIKEHRPKYNILMRDDKSYPYLLLSFHPYPRLQIYRGAQHKHAEFYGPFPSSSAVKQTLKLMQKTFQLRSCRDPFFNGRQRPCLQHQIHRCSAPCVQHIALPFYQEHVQQARLLLQGKSETVIQQLMSHMDAAAYTQDYEKAALYRDRITDVRHIQALQAITLDQKSEDIFESMVAYKKKYYAQRESLQQALQLTELPQRMECFDISHLQGEAMVASCVVFNSEGPLKSEYRRFSIRDITPGDDYAAMRQALQRHYTRLQTTAACFPDLILIDGGWGQVNIALQVLRALRCDDIPVIGVAKGVERTAGCETILYAQGQQELIFERNHPGFLLIQQIRDEAHRFAGAGHKAMRKKKRTTSILENIPGVGAKRRRELLRYFGGLQGVQQAGEKEIAKVAGVGAGLAKVIFEHLH